MSAVFSLNPYGYLHSNSDEALKGTYGILFLRPLFHFNANSHHYYYRIRKILRNHNRCCSQRSTFFLFLTVDCRGRVREDTKKGWAKIAQPFWG